MFCTFFNPSDKFTEAVQKVMVVVPAERKNNWNVVENGNSHVGSSVCHRWLHHRAACFYHLMDKICCPTWFFFFWSNSPIWYHVHLPQYSRVLAKPSSYTMITAHFFLQIPPWRRSMCTLLPIILLYLLLYYPFPLSLLRYDLQFLFTFTISMLVFIFQLHPPLCLTSLFHTLSFLIIEYSFLRNYIS